MLDNLHIDEPTKARVTITRIRKIQIAAMETAKIRGLNLVMICPFCEARQTALVIRRAYQNHGAPTSNEF
jgi:hypothetical protein